MNQTQTPTEIHLQLQHKMREFNKVSRSFEITDAAVRLAHDLALVSAQLSIAVNAERAKQDECRVALRGDIA